MELDSYIDAGVLVSVGLVNALTKGHAHGRPVGGADALAAVRQVLAVDPPSAAAVTSADLPAFAELAEQLRSVFEDLDHARVDAAARRLNALLARHPASPHLAREDGVWRLHHHPADAPLLPMWTSICAEGLARMIGAQAAHRLGVCSAMNCDRVFVDTTKNASRRFCSLSCQNRVKTAAFRRRRARA